MIKAIILIAIFCFFVMVAPSLIGEKGYVLIAFGDTSIESTLVGAAILLLLAFVTLWLVAKIALLVIGSLRRTRWYFKLKQENKVLANESQLYWGLFNRDYQWLKGALDSRFLPERAKAIAIASQARAHFQDGDNTKAAALFEQLSAAEQGKAYSLAQHLLDGKDAEAVADELRQSALGKGANEYSLLAYGNLVAKSDSAKLKSVLNHIAKKHQDGVLWQPLFQAYFATSQFTDLSARYEQLSRKAQLLGQVAYLQAALALESAAAVEKLLIRLVQQGNEAKLRQVLIATEQAFELLALQKALQSRLKKEEQNPDLLWSYAHLARLSNDTQLATQVFDKALRMNAPVNQQERKVVAATYAKVGQYANAWQLLDN